MGRIKRIIERNPRKFKRTLIFSLIALFLAAFFFLPNVVFADGIGDLIGSEMHARDISQLVKTISHIVYVFIWPCLAIAGAALDNSLIYGSFLHLDAALWNIWNIMKNFANFALGFIFIFTIVRNLFAGSFGGSTYDPVQGAKKVIEKTLISGVLVQMSWFLVAALIDLSTILIYAVGGIPLSMLGSYDNNVTDVPIMKLNVVVENDDSSYYYSYGGHNYAGCLIANKDGDVAEPILLQGLTGEYIVGREKLKMPDGTPFESGYCALYGYLYKYQELETSNEYLSGCYELGTNSEYLTCLKQELPQLESGVILGYKDNCNFINAYNREYKSENGQCTQVCQGYGEVAYTGDVFSGTTNGLKLKDLMENSKGWVGPFVTMYSSILNYQELVMNPGSDSVMGNLFGFIINTFFALILFIPVAVLMVLLIIRIGFLWIVVAISPILILVNYGPLGDKIKNNDLLKKFGITEIIKQIFLPVVVVFAVSLCIVFLSTLYKSKPNYDDASQTLSAFGIEKVSSSENPGDGNNSQNQSECVTTGRNMSSETYSVLGLVTVRLNAQNYNHGKDLFVWVLMELLATGIVWFFMKTAINLMSEKGKKFMSTAEKYVTTLPLIQLPGVEGKVGLHALGIGEGNQDKIISNLDSKVRQLTGADAQDAALRNRFGGGDNSNNSNDSESSASLADAINYIRSNSGVTYDKLDKKYQDVLASVGYNSGNFNTLTEAVTASNYGDLLKTSPSGGGSQGHTNSDAVTYTRAQLDAAVKTDDAWRNRASGMVAGAVQTSDGVFMVDLLNGKSNTANPGNQQYEIVDRDTYEKRHFPQVTNGIQNVSKTEYEQYTKKQQEDLARHFKEINEEMERLEKLNSVANPTTEEQHELNALKNAQNGITNLNLTLQQLQDKMKELGIQ